jgi:hypothetical protein
MITIYLLYSGKKILYSVDPFVYISTIKLEIRTRFNLEYDTIKLLFGGKILSDVDTLEKVGVTKECTLNVIGSLNSNINTNINTNTNTNDLKHCLILELVKPTSNIVQKPIWLSQISKIKKYVICKTDKKYTLIINGYTINMDFINNKAHTLEKIRKCDQIIKKHHYFPILTDIQTKIIKSLFETSNKKSKSHDIKCKLINKTVSELIGNQLSSDLINEFDQKMNDFKKIDDNLLMFMYNTYNNTNILSKYYLVNKKIPTIQNLNMLTTRCYNSNNITLLVPFSDYDNVRIVTHLLKNNYKFNNLDNLNNLENFTNITTLCNSCKKYILIDLDIKKIESENYYCCDDCCATSIINSSQETFDTYVREQNLTKCPNCHINVELIPNEPSNMLIKKCDRNNNLDPDHSVEFYCTNRYLCSYCKKDFCVHCNKTPYHNNFTCEHYTDYMRSEKCKYCLDPMYNITECENEICKLNKTMCETHITSCGHNNYGITDYELCLVCENKDTYEEICGVCVTDKLHEKPCIKLDCGHIFHLDCIKTRSSINPTDNITTNHTHCPTCFFRISHGYLQNDIDNYQTLNKTVESLTEIFIKNNNLSDPIKDITPKLIFHKCTKCSDVYLKGLADCQLINNAENPDNPDNPDNPNNIKNTMLCPKCDIIGKHTCPLHSSEYIIYKCDFCCSPSVWKCSSGYYCQPCHKMANNIKRHTCLGKGKCPLLMDHPCASTEKQVSFPIGCSLCLPEDFKLHLKWLGWAIWSSE